jgi:hypothetical protein
MQALERRTGIDPDLLAEVALHRAVCVERLRLASGDVQSADPQLPRALPEWLLGRERRQRADRLGGATRGEHRGKVVLDDQQPLLDQPVVLRAAGRGRGELGLAAPVCAGLTQQRLGLGVVAGQRGQPRASAQVLDDQDVERAGFGDQPVPRAAPVDRPDRWPSRCQGGSQPGQVRLDGLRGGGWRVVPERPGDGVDGHRSWRGEGEQGEHLPRLASLDRYRSVRAVQAYRPEHGQPHDATIRATAAEPQPRSRTLGP